MKHLLVSFANLILLHFTSSKQAPDTLRECAEIAGSGKAAQGSTLVRALQF